MDAGVRNGGAPLARRGLLAAGATALLAGCGAADDLVEDRSQLPVLLGDPMAGGPSRMATREKFERGKRRLLDMSQCAEVRRTFDVEYDLRSAFERAVSFAKKAGWVSPFEGDASRVMKWHGEKFHPRRDCYIHTSYDPDDQAKN